jgi:P2-related tail formation protein
MNFSKALELLKQGHKIARSGWNGKNMFIYYVPANSYPASRNLLETMDAIFPDNLVPYQAYIAMMTTQNTVVPWLASQTDLLAEDWVSI